MTRDIISQYVKLHVDASSDDFIIMYDNAKYPMIFSIVVHDYKPISIHYYAVTSIHWDSKKEIDEVESFTKKSFFLLLGTKLCKYLKNIFKDVQAQISNWCFDSQNPVCHSQ